MTRYILIQDKQVVGSVPEESMAPSCFDVLAYEGEEPLNQLRWVETTNSVAPIPPKPEEPGDWVWYISEWVNTYLPPPVPEPVLVELPDNHVDIKELLDQPITQQVMVISETDTKMLSLVVQLIAAWITNQDKVDAAVQRIVVYLNELSNSGNPG